MSFIKSLSIIFILVLTQGCLKKSVVERENVKGLSKKVAFDRASVVSNVSYLLNIDLSKSKDSDEYTGVSTINFEASKAKGLSVDFIKGEITALVVNNTVVEKIDYNGNFVKIDKNFIKKGANSIALSFKQKFSKTGSGLYKFKDEIDGKVYVYTDFEPYDANMFAPLFDQPNLKAKYTLAVVVPDDWKVISSIKENRKAIQDNGVQWFFPESSKFSTYILALHAGPYKVWRKAAKVNGREIPMGLFARESLASFVKPEFWFKVTEKGFNYFEEYFDTSYPYTKYDQVLVPDFNSGAMENVAAVTFNERFVSRDKIPLRSQRAGLANVILHEMAHMWFGNLVTMDWWNDLWLNESFATFMANSGTFEVTEFNEAWLTFFNRTKQWAYSEDQWRTTHPIEAPIESTEVALTNFDGITYGKGASSLKQLVFLIGVDNFKKGLSQYFKKFSEKNTTLSDFMGALQENTKEDLNSWTKLWLQKEGLNSVKAEPVCIDGKLDHVKFTQGFVSGLDVMRPHKTKVALWLKGSVKGDPDVLFDFKYDKKINKWQSKKEMNCPVAIFPNWGDHDYVKVVLDEKSLDTFSKNLNQVSFPLLRSQVWSALWSMVRMAELEPKEMHQIVLSQLKNETDNVVLNSVIAGTSGSGPYRRLYYYYKDKELARKDRAQLASFFKKRITEVSNLDTKKILFGGWVTMADEKSLVSVESCLSTCDFNVGFEIDQDRRWWLISKVAVYRGANFKKLLEAEVKRDKGRRAELSALSAKVLFSKDKKKWLDKVFSKNDLALKEKTTILRGVAPSTQRDEYLDLIDETFVELSSNLEQQPSRVQRTFAGVFAPFYCGDKKSKMSLSESKIRSSKWSPSVKKSLLQSLDREERCLKIKN